MKIGLHISLLGLLASLAVGCVSTSDSDVPVKTHYTLELGKTEKNAPPMPSKTPIYVKWHFSDGRAESSLAFKGWDFDEDGRFEMVQVLNTDGSTQAYVYDFDGDGEVDKKQLIQPSHEEVSVLIPMSTAGDHP